MAGTNRPDIINLDVRTLRRDDASQSDKITLAGITYTIDKVLSDTTGEGEIFKISNGGNIYVLKLYYPGYAPNLEVVKTLKEAAGTGVLVDIIEYGTAEYRGESRFFELMPFYSGGELKPGTMRVNPDKLKATALGMIMAIKTAHDHKLLHLDIKPNNFFYTDESHTTMVLADFGISHPFAYRDGKFEIVMESQTRTPIYAAPELYYTIQNSTGKWEIRLSDEKSDYFSLGMAILTLWAGEDELNRIGEIDLNKLKRHENGSVPMPDDMPSDIVQLIKGLTTPNPVKRWAFEEFTRWLKGEDVPVDGEEKKEESTGLHIVYSGSKGQTAESLEDIAAFMLDDRKLAANYLYSGKISKWLTDAGYPELTAQIDEFILKTYPKNQQAGVTAVTYLLDPTLPYVSPKGKALRTQQEIAADIAGNNSVYDDEIKNRDSSLYIYFNALGAPLLADKFVPLAQKRIVTAMWRLVFTLDPSQPFPVLDPQVKKYDRVNTVAQLFDKFAELPPYSWDDGAMGYAELLYDEAFIIWLKYRDRGLAGKIESKLAPYVKMTNKPKQLYYYVLYLLDPSRPFELENSEEYKHHTAEELARQINLDYLCSHIAGITEMRDPKYLVLPQQLMDCRDNRLYFYLKSKEVYQEKIDYIHYAFDFNIKEHKNSTGPYDKDVAFFKAVKALAGEAQYAFFIDGVPKFVFNLEDLKEIPIEYQKEELRNGKLKEWLAVQYHEDPFADLSEQYAYEDLLYDYTWHLNDIDDEEKVVERFTEASYEVISRQEKIKKLLWANYIWRALFCLLIALPLLGLAAYVAIKGCASFANPSPLWNYLLLAIPITIGLRVVQIFPKTDEWLLQPFGSKLFQPMLLHRWIVSAIYAIVFCSLLWTLEKFGGGIAGHIIIPVLCIAVVMWRYVLTIKDYPLVRNRFQDAINPDAEALVYEPLYWAWRGYKDGDFDSETLDRQNVYIDGIKAARYFCITRTLFSLIPVVVVIALYIPFSKPLESYIKQNDPQRWEKVYGEGSVNDEEQVATTRYYAYVKKSLSVRKSASKNAGKLGSLEPKEEIEVVSIDDGWAKIVYGDGVGYVDASYIKPVNNESNSTPAKKSEASGNPKTSATQSAEPVPAPVPAAPKLYTPRPDYNQIDVFSAKNAQSQFMIGELPAGATFEILSDDGTWAKIIYKGRDAYVKTMMIVPVEN